jgi:tetratricopeptide (TPR) repeat protein
MGVRYVLEGSVRKSDTHVRVTAQLLDATTGEHLWAEHYDRPFTDIFALQDEVVQKIVTTLGLQLSVQEQGYIVRKHTDNLEAYDAWLRAVEYFLRFTKAANAQARQLCEKALVLDPQYAEVYVGLGWTYWMEWSWRWSADPQNVQRAFEMAQRALALDGSLPQAHSLLSCVYAQQQRPDQALAEGERAIALDLNNAESYFFQAAALNLAGRPEEAIRMIERAQRLNPRYPFYYLAELGSAYRAAGRYAEAIATLQDLLSRNPDNLFAYFYLAFGYVQQWAFQQGAEAQTLARALAAAQRTLALNAAFPRGHTILGVVYLWQKQYEPALAEMEQAVALDPQEAWARAVLADGLSSVGRSEEAIRMVEQAQQLQPSVVDRHLDSVGAAYYLAGQPAEAVAPLKRYLSRYPNILGAHLTLATAYSELGKEAEARAEAAEVLRINPKFSLEVHKQRVPIKDPAVLERHIAALRKAGLK